ncbi:hypothetical protein Tco_1037836 [Tanacetum coccineum]
MTTSKSFNNHPKHVSLYHALMESILIDEDAMDQDVADKQKKKKPDDEDRGEDPSTRSDQGLKKRKKSKDAELPKRSNLFNQKKYFFEAADTEMPLNQKDDMKNIDAQLDGVAVTKDDWFMKPARPPTPDPEWIQGKSVDSKPTQTWLNDLANVKNLPLTFNDLMSTPIDFSAFAMNRQKIKKLTKADLVGPIFNLLKGTCKSYVELEYNMDEYYCALSDQLDWNNPERNRCPYYLNKPLPLQEIRGCLTVPADFFFNNDLEYLRGGSTDRKYTTSITKTKAAKYDVEGIEDMVPNVWSPIKVAYDKHAALGISHWGPKRRRFYGYVINRKSRHDVYSTMRILSVTSVTVKKWYGYGYLKEIIVRRSDQKLYKLMEGDFPRLHLNNIEDMFLLAVQNRHNNVYAERHQRHVVSR